MNSPRFSHIFPTVFGCICLLMATSCKQDQAPPVLRLHGPSLLVVSRGAAYTDPGYIAFDDADYDITDLVTMTSDIDTHRIGDYHVTYEVADDAGNVGTATRTVRVAHTEASLLGQYHSSTAFNFCPTSGTATIARSSNGSNSLYIAPAVGNSFSGSLINVTLTGYPSYQLQSSNGHLPCGYRVTEGIGLITPDGDSIQFSCKVTSEINSSNFYYITIDYSKL